MVKSKNFKIIIIKLVLFVILLIIIFSGVLLCARQKSQRYLAESTNIENSITNQENEFYIRLVDNYFDDEDLDRLYEVNNAESLLKKFNEVLNEQYDFYEITFQAFQSLNYLEIDDKFFEKYGKDKEMIKNQEIKINGKNRYVSSLNTVQVNQRAFERFFNNILKGRGFQNDDFLYKEREIPVILGYDYMENYHIGDIFELNYLETDMKMEVIGFFEDGLTLDIDNTKYELNTYICSPYFQIKKAPATDAERLFQLRYYLQKNQGYIHYLLQKTDSARIDESIVLKDQEKSVQEKAAQFGLDYTILMFPSKISANSSH